MQISLFSKMNSNRSPRNIKNQVSRPSGESELDESRVLEKRLKKLLTNVGEQEQPRTIFNDIQEVPKLRSSIVTRAVQSVICSTPMVTEKTRDFFCTDNSLNISPIDSISEEVEVNEYKTGQDDERSKKLQNEIPQGNLEAKIILTRAALPIVISDSDEEVQCILERKRSKKLKKNIQVESHYNTRSISKKISEHQNTENSVGIEYLKDISNNKHNLRDKNKAMQQNKQNRTHSAQIKVDSLLKNDSTKQNTTNVHTSVKSIQYKSPKNNSNLKNKKNAGADQIPSTSHRKESVSSQTPLNNSNSKSNQNVSNRNLKALDCIDNTNKNYEQTELVSPRLGRSRKFSSKLEYEITDQSKKHAIQTGCQNVSAVNNYEQDEPAEIVGSWLNGIENAKEFKKSATYNGQNSEKSIRKSGSKSAGKTFSSTKLIKNRDVGKDQRRIPPRKLSFSSKDGDKKSESDVPTEEGDENIFEAIKEPVKISEIPSLRSRAKSRENNLETLNSTKKNVDIKVSVDNKEYPSEREKSLPKRPPRKKMLKKKSTIAVSEVCENILSNPQEELNGFLKNSIGAEGKTTTTTKLQNDTKLQQNNGTNGAEVSENKRNPKKTLVEVGLSPIKFTPEVNSNVAKCPEKAAEAGLSNRNINSEREILTFPDNEKAKKLNQLICQLSQYANCLVVDKSSSDAQLQNENVNANKKNKDLTRPLSNHIEMSNKEVQTSLKRTNLRNRRKASQLTPDLCKKAIHAEGSNSSKSTLTDSSEIIKDVEKTYLLFESVEDNDNFNFSSSDDEAFGSSCLKNGPWRLDENLKIFPRRSSCKLNFLRSVQEIEMDKELQGHNKYYESDNELNSETTNLENMTKKLSVLPLPVSVGCEKKSEVQMYSKSTLRTNEKISKNIAIKSPDVDERPLTSRTSDFVTSEPDPDHAPDEHNTERSYIISKFMEGIKDKSSSNKDTTLKSSVQTTTDVRVNEKNNFEDIDPVPCLRISSSNTEETVHKSSPSNEGNENSRYSNKKEKAISLSVNKRTSKSNRTNSSDHQMENIVQGDDGEILAVPLEHSVPSVLENALETDENVDDRAEHQRSLVIVLDNVIKSPTDALHSENKNSTESQSKSSPFHKPVKAKASRSRKKKIIPENEDGISSTTEDSETTGIRRSRRERRPPARRYYGAIATYSERMVEYYNGPGTTCNSTGSKSTKTRTKKREQTKKDTNGDIIRKSVEKKGKRGRSKNKSNIQPQELNTDAANLGVDINVTVIDKFNVGMENSSMNPMNSSTGKHRSETYCDNSTHCISQYAPNKRSKTRDDNENYQKSSDSTPNNPGNVNTYSDDGSHLGEMDNNGISDNAQDNSNRFCPPSHTGSQEDFAFQSSLPQDNLYSSGKFNSVSNKVAEKDSGRSTMLKSCTFEESNMRIGKSQTGRISKNFKKKNNMCSKISKVLSRSINTSREQEIFNEREVDTIDSLAINNTEDARSRRTSIMRTPLTDDEYINLWSNESLISLRYVDKTANFKLVKDNLMVADGLKNVKDGGTMGYLKIPPAGQKALHIARKFALFYFVIEGEGFVQVHNKTSRVGKLSTFIIPLGIEYSILNISKRDPLNLGFVKMPAGHGSQDGS